MKPKQLFEPYFDDLLKENFLFVAPYILTIYPFMAVIDSQMAHGRFLLFLFLRVLFVIPVLISYIGLKKRYFTSTPHKHIYTLFISTGLGVCVISYFLGGMTSDYYFGLIIISFLQFTFVPLKAKNGLFLDIFYFVAFFTINNYDIPFDKTLFIKQSSNFISFVVFKYLASKRSSNLIFGSMHRYTLDKESSDNKDAAELFGELCHLISNPLFISQSLVKKALQKTRQTEVENLLSKSLHSHERISIVVKKMLQFNREQANIKTYKNSLINPENNSEIDKG